MGGGRGGAGGGEVGEPVCPRGKAGKQRDICSIPFRLSLLFKGFGLWVVS